jgi:trk system potassium uptake protein TrkH
MASCCFLGVAILCDRKPNTSKFLGFFALMGCAAAGLQPLTAHPLFALFGGASLIQAGFFLVDLPSRPLAPERAHHAQLLYSHARSSLFTTAGLALLAFVFNPGHLLLGEQAITVSVLISQLLVTRWLWNRMKGAWRILVPAWLLIVGALSGLGLSFHLSGFTALALSLFGLWFLPRGQAGLVEHREQWWEPFLNHPARALISTFFGLCLMGTLLLQLPWAASGEAVSTINAAFTSVSAVCVTGLTVLDTAHDFSPFGQVCILLLIQLGGLGIMTITTVALHAMGKRLSLRQERLLTTLTDTSHQDLILSLISIVRFTLICELIGAALLAIGFWQAGIPYGLALWKGLFTAVSAFCNAGFALDSANLVPFQGRPLILHTVAILIILGGLAPATCLLIPQWLQGRRIDLAPRVALVSSATLLLIGTCSFLVFEWDQTLIGLSFADKLHNAWFQSVTLRTAGFNSVDLGEVLTPTLLVMLCSMFIGGSPGGTAGGIKTTTIGVLALTFWATINGQSAVVVQNRRIVQETINRAITVCAAGIIVLLAVVMALSLTQPLSPRQLIFEATSALGTVGLSLGATPHLDTIGKIIIMLTMFIGRIGPMTLFTLLSTDHQSTESRYPDARITLT